MKPDGWTICTVDGGLSAYFEHTVAITDKGPLILTAQPKLSKAGSGVSPS
jgi:methionine aminopeptidase